MEKWISFSYGRGLARSAALAEPPTTVKIGFYFLNVLILEIAFRHFARAFGVRSVLPPLFGNWGRSAEKWLEGGMRCPQRAGKMNAALVRDSTERTQPGSATPATTVH